MNLLQLSWKNIISKPLNMTLSLVLFALGVGLISLLFVLNKQVQDKFDKNQAGIDLVIGAKGSPLQMILCNMYHVDSPTGNISIKDARPFLNPKHPLIRLSVPLSLGDSYRGYRIVGTTHEFVDSLYYGEIGEGKLWEKDFEVIIGAATASELGLKIGDTFHSSHGLNDGDMTHDEVEPFKIVGILQANGSVIDQLIITNTQSIWKVHDNHAEETAENIDSIAPAPKSLMDHVDKDITSILVKYRNKKDWRALNLPRNINENTDMQAAYPAWEINRLYSMMGVGMDALQVLALIIVIVSGLSIFISLFSSLKDRKYELALMRVMGASPGKLFSLIVLEGLLLAVLGYILGISLSHIGMELLAEFMKDSYRYSFSGMQFLKEEIWLLGGALAIGFVAAIIPAFEARNTDISETLSKA